MKTALEQLDRMEALVRRMAAREPDMPNGNILNITAFMLEADAIVAELLPIVEPDVVTARQIIQLTMIEGAGVPPNPKIVNGSWDESPQMVALVSALRRAREEGVR